MKKLHLLILKNFIGVFLITFSVLIFIFLTQNMMRYVDDLAGKGIGAEVFAELFFFFSFNVWTRALPLAIMMSALITYGNLGEHNELTAIKSSGISLTRVIYPVFILVVLISIGSHYFSDYVVPKTNLKAYSLLYDIRQKKPTLDVREGVFYNGIPGYSIRIQKKHENGKSISGVLIYDHTQHRGSTDHIMADSGLMYSIHNERYLVLELFNGISNSEQVDENQVATQEFSRTRFKKTKMIFDLSSFLLNRTPEELFMRNKMMKTAYELDMDIDSLRTRRDSISKEAGLVIQPMYRYKMVDSTVKAQPDPVLPSTTFTDVQRESILQSTYSQVKNLQSIVSSKRNDVYFSRHEELILQVEKMHKYTEPFACIVFFLIGAPIGAIIKKGGLGVPVLIAVMFFIISYVFSILGEKFGKADLIDIYGGIWLGNIILLPVGAYFMIQAHRDARLFEIDYYKNLFRKKKVIQ